MKKSGRWQEQEDALLKQAVDRLGAKQWRKIAEHVPGRTSIQCLHRWTKILKPGLIKGPWTIEEDEKLREWVNRRKGAMKWADATKEIPGRSGKQIRERWFNILNPTINKAKWTKDEERLLFQLYQKYGPKWCSLVQYFKNRTENSIKNRFYSTLRKFATEYKRSFDKRKNTNNIDQEEVDPQLYFENPQVAKTEELLRFLPLVMENLKADSESCNFLQTNDESPRKTSKPVKEAKIIKSAAVKTVDNSATKAKDFPMEQDS